MEIVSSIFYQALPVLLALFIPAIFVLARHLVQRLGESLDIKDEKLLDELIMVIVSQGVAYAEQIAKKLADDKKLSNEEKMQLAINYVKQSLITSGIVDFTATEIANRIEALLGMVNNYGDNLNIPLIEGENNEDFIDD